MKTFCRIFILLCAIATYSCSKDTVNEPLEISYQAKLSVNDDQMITDKIYYKDIIGYDTSNYTFLIESNTAENLRKYFFPNGGSPFTVNVLGEKIYTGKFFPLYSQTMPYGLTIDPYRISNTLTVNCDYGLGGTDNTLIDARNDKRIIAMLKKDNKIMKIDL
jgi:hypothetical protein